MAQAMTIYKSLVGNDLRSRPSSVSQSRSTYDDIGDGSNKQAEYQSPASDESTVTTSPNAFSVKSSLYIALGPKLTPDMDKFIYFV